jgi:hypothetical protein
LRTRTLLLHGRQFLSHVLPGILKPLLSLWHEVIGFLFICLAVIPGFSAFRAIRDFNGEPDSLFRIVLTLLFMGIMAYYGITSFLRARRISRS